MLPVDGSGEVAPALFDSNEEGGFAQTPEEEEAPSEELEEKLITMDFSVNSEMPIVIAVLNIELLLRG